MTSVLYYSNYCDNSKKLLARLANSSVKNEIHFVCIDQRSKEPNGQTYVHMQNGSKLILQVYSLRALITFAQQR